MGAVRHLGIGARVTCSVAIVVLIAVGQGAGAPTARAAPHVVARLGPHGIGTIQFGLPKRRALVSLSAVFGVPAARGVNTGCGPRYTEVVWGDLVAEFRMNTFSGYRYLEGGYPLTTPGSPRGPRPEAVSPRLATSTGITLGSTLAQLQRAYAVLHVAGADKWRAGNGLVFVDNSERDPAPASSRIIEIKVGTCGDF